MKFFPASILFAAAIFTASGSLCAQTVDEIVSKHVAAMGGESNWNKVTSVKLTGSMNAGGVELPVTVTTVDKKGYRMEFSMNGIVNYAIVTPSSGWMYFPTQGQTKPEAMPDELVKDEDDQMDVSMDALVDYKAKGNKVALLGKDDVEGTECYKLKVTHKNGKEETVFLDLNTLYTIRIVEKSKANGQETEEVSNLGNYQILPEGIVYPMSIETSGTPMKVTKVEVNNTVDENIFKPTEIKK